MRSRIEEVLGEPVPVGGLCTDGRSKAWSEELVDGDQGKGYVAKDLKRRRDSTRAIRSV